MTAAITTVRRALAQSGLVPVDAHALLGHVLGVNRAWLAAHGDDPLAPDHAAAFAALATRRRAGEPVAYLTGRREFWGLALDVSPAVLIPRPETETLVEAALARLPADRAQRVLDLGTGSGAVALAIASERPLARVLAIDAAEDALAVAAGNARRLGLDRVAFARGDWYDAVPAAWRDAPFDLVVSNPPYIGERDPHLGIGDLRFEPAQALSPGGEGTAALRTIVAGARAWLVAGGTLAVEHGHDQSDAVRALFDAAGFVATAVARDLAGIERVVAGRAP